MKEEVMHLVREDQLLEWNVPCTQQPDKIHRLAEIDVPVVVTMDEQYR